MKTLLILLSITFISCTGLFEPNTVEYTVTGTAKSASITMNTSSGGTEQRDVEIPYSKVYDDFGDDFLYISAQNNGTSGSVTVTIYVKGSKVKSTTSSGAYVIATASGSM